jgi:hypothetical protein
MRGVLVPLLLSAGMGILPACAELHAQGGTDATSQPPSVVTTRSTQLIIKFRDPRLDPSQPQLLDEIGRDAGARLVHVRPMSGGAYVLRLENPADGAELDRIIGRLEKRPDVEYVEPDRPMQHMREKLK